MPDFKMQRLVKTVSPSPKPNQSDAYGVEIEQTQT